MSKAAKTGVHNAYTTGAPSVHRRSASFGLLALLGLAACNAPLSPLPTAPGMYRDAAALIGATTRFNADQFAGDWQVRASYPEEAGLHTVAFNVTETGAEVTAVSEICAGSGVCTRDSKRFAASETGQGRYQLRSAGGQSNREMWVLWVDEGFRTAVVGNPAGSFAWILDRNATGGAGRIVAAREILDFNGYDVSQLRTRK